MGTVLGAEVPKSTPTPYPCQPAELNERMGDPFKGIVTHKLQKELFP